MQIKMFSLTDFCFCQAFLSASARRMQIKM